MFTKSTACAGCQTGLSADHRYLSARHMATHVKHARFHHVITIKLPILECQ